MNKMMPNSIFDIICRWWYTKIEETNAFVEVLYTVRVSPKYVELNISAHAVYLQNES